MARQESSYLHVSNNWRGYRIISCSLHSGNLCFLFVLFLFDDIRNVFSSVSFRVEQISRTTPQILQMAVAAVVVAAAVVAVVVAVDAAVIVVVTTAAAVETV